MQSLENSNKEGSGKAQQVQNASGIINAVYVLFLTKFVWLIGGRILGPGGIAIFAIWALGWKWSIAIALVLSSILGYRSLWVLGEETLYSVAFLFILKLTWQWLTEIAIAVSIIAIIMLITYKYGLHFPWAHSKHILGVATSSVVSIVGWKWSISIAVAMLIVIPITAVLIKMLFYKVFITGDVGIDLCNRAISIARIGAGNKALEGIAYGGLALISRSRCDYKTALEYRNRQLSLAQEIEVREMEAYVYGRLGYNFWALDDLEAAIDCFRQQLKIVKELDDKAETRQAYLNLYDLYGSLGIACVVLGDCRKAIECHEAQLRIAKKKLKDKAGEGRAHRNLGNVCYQMGDSWSAVSHYDLQLRFANEVGDKAEEGEAYENLGKAYYCLSDFQRALDFHNRHLAIAKKTRDRTGEGRAYGNLGCVYAAFDDSKKAIDCHNLNLRIAQEVGDKGAEAQAYRELGQSFEKVGHLPESLECYRSSVAVFNDGRDHLKSEDKWKTSLVRNECQLSFAGLLRVLLKQEKSFEALVAAEEGRAKALADLTESRYGIPGSLSQEEAKSYLDLMGCSFSSTVFLSYEFGESQINFWALSEGRHVNFRKKKLDDDFDLNEALAYASEQIYVRAGVQGENRSLNEVKELSASKKFQRESSQPSKEAIPLTTLYKILIEPVADLVQGKELIIIPDGQLWLAPYVAFLDPYSKHLCESFRVRLIPSLTSLKMITHCPQGHHCKSGALLVGDPYLEELTNRDGEKLYKQLEFAKQEVEMIGKILKIKPLTGKQATKAEVLKRLSSVALVHIAAQGRMKTGEIVLSPNPERIFRIPTKDDYILTMRDALNAQLRARLVVLSCLHTAREGIKAESVVGIAHAFMGAGARFVLVSLWEVDDEATLEFMRSFYNHLVQGKSASESLNQARKDLRESDKYSDVKYWAPFVLIGDDVTLEFDEKN